MQTSHVLLPNIRSLKYTAVVNFICFCSTKYSLQEFSDLRIISGGKCAVSEWEMCMKVEINGIWAESTDQKHIQTTYLLFIHLFIYHFFRTQACPERMCTNETRVPCKVPSLPNPTTCQGWPHHRGLWPLLFSNSDVGSFTSHQTNHWKCCETGPTVFHCYPRRLESLTICRCHYKGSTFFSVI